jgi:phosphate-selective porin
MRTLFVAIAALGLATASQSYAQPEHGGHKAAADATVSVKDPANPTHEECKSVMGRKMDGRVMHDHASMKGTPGVMKMKPLSKAEMDKMHGKCAAKMAEAKK